MKKLTLILLVFVSLPALSSGYPGMIGLWADQSFTDCDLNDHTTGLVTVYVAHHYTDGAQGTRFMLSMDSGTVLTYIGSSSPYYTYGDPYSGICVDYGECKENTFLILTINYFGMGISTPCGRISVEPDPAVPSGTIEVLDCEGNVAVGTGGILVVNNDGSCPCIAAGLAQTNQSGIHAKPVILRRSSENASSYCPEPPSPVNHGSWGHIKALYN